MNFLADKKVLHMAAGDSHNVFVVENRGQVELYGNGKRYAMPPLVFPDEDPQYYKFCKLYQLQLPKNEQVRFIKAGTDFTVMVANSNKVYISRNTTLDSGIWIEVQYESDEPILELSVSELFFIVRTKQNIYGAGLNEYFVLGVKQAVRSWYKLIRNNQVPQLFKDVPSYELISASCGQYNVYVLVQSLPASFNNLPFILLAVFASLLGVLSLVIVVCAVAVIKVVRAKNRLAKTLENADEELQRKLMENDANSPDFAVSIDKQLFEIKFEDLKDLKEIGAGSSGAIVYRARFHSDWVAIKLFKTTFLDDQKEFDKFSKELKLVAYVTMILANIFSLVHCVTTM